jgi:hypothetical protein
MRYYDFNALIDHSKIRIKMTRSIAYIIIGLLVGAGITYLYIDNQDRMTNSGQIKEYEDKLKNINKQLEELQSDYNNLETQFNQLEKDYTQLSDEYNELLNDYERALGAIPISPEPLTLDTIEREYSWLFNRKQWTISLSIPENIYDYFTNMERPPTQDYSIYVTNPYDDQYLRTIIERINFISISDDLTESEKLNLVISFVQSLPYTSDSLTTSYDEYPRYPLQTLVDQGGDCEDTSILVSALLYEMNYEVILLGLPNHMACGVYSEGLSGSYYMVDGKRFFYLETTDTGWKIGEVPEEYNDVSAYFYELKAIPIITHEWSAKSYGDSVEVSITVRNQGTAIANGLRVYVAFDNENGNYVWNAIESDSFDINFGNEITLELGNTIPLDEHTRLIVGILDNDGYLIDVSYSDWFDT